MEDNSSVPFTWRNLESHTRQYPTRLQDLFNELMYACQEIMIKTPNSSTGKSVHLVNKNVIILLCNIRIFRLTTTNTQL